MASERQIVANRKNSLLATGPKTPGGKAKSRLNALRHGGYAIVLTPDETNKDLVRLQKLYLAHYRPNKQLDIEQVRVLAWLDFRLRRYGRMEGEILTAHGFERDPEHQQDFYYAGVGWGFSNDCGKTKSVSHLSPIEDRLARRFRACKKELDEKFPPAPEPKTSGPEASPGLSCAPEPHGENI